MGDAPPSYDEAVGETTASPLASEGVDLQDGNGVVTDQPGTVDFELDREAEERWRSENERTRSSNPDCCGGGCDWSDNLCCGCFFCCVPGGGHHDHDSNGDCCQCGDGCCECGGCSDCGDCDCGSCDCGDVDCGNCDCDCVIM